MAMFGSKIVAGEHDPMWRVLGADPFGVPDYMGGINGALAQNAALGQSQKPKKGGKFGDFLASFAGLYGDSLTGNPVYSQGIKKRQDSEAAERDQQAQKDWWYEQQRYKAENEKPDLPGLIDEFTTAKSLGMIPEGMKYTDYVALKNPGVSAPVVLPHNVDRVDDGGAVTAVNPQTGEKIRFNPTTNAWEAVGGPSPQGSGGFLR